MKKLLSEIINEVNSIHGRGRVQKQAELLRQYDSQALRTLIRYIVLPELKMNLPEGAPPYDELDPINAETFLYKEARLLYLFNDIEQPNLAKQPAKKERLFINLLESIHPEDAKLIIAIKDNEISNITRRVAVKAFPDMGF